MSLPLTLPAFMLNSTSSVQVSIISNYYTAQVKFYAGSTTVFIVTLIQSAPFVQLPPYLKIGSFVIQQGTLTMLVPSPTQAGRVNLNCTYTDSNVKNPTALNSVIGTWTLNQ